MSDDENDVHTPTQSEFATFEILANRDYTNMSKKKPKSKDLRHSFPVDVVEEEQEHDHEDDFEDFDRSQNQSQNQNQNKVREEDKNDVKSIASSIPETESIPKIHSQSEPPSPIQSIPPITYNQSQNQAPETFSSQPQYSSTPTFSSSTNNSNTNTTHKQGYKETIEKEIRDEKEGLLTELLALGESGQCKLVRTLTMNDSLEEISFQYDRCQAEIEARRMVNLAKSSIDVGAGLLEMVAKNFGFGLLDGYHKSLCSDMNRFDRPLTKIYKKYWRRGSQKPEMELAMIVIGSFGWTVMSNMMKDGTYMKKFFGGKKDKDTEKDKEVESIKAKFSTQAPSTPPPPSPASSVGAKKMRPPSSSMNLSSPWVPVSSKPQIEVIDDKKAEMESALQSLKLKELELEKRMERIARLEEEMTRKAEVQVQVQEAQKQKTLIELAEENIDVSESEEEEEKPTDLRRVVMIASPPQSGRKSGRKSGPKQPIVRL